MPWKPKTHWELTRRPMADAQKDDGFYKTDRWKKVRWSVLQDEPLCVMCGGLANEVDHIIPRKQCADPYDRLNLQPLCSICHARKTRRGL